MAQASTLLRFRIDLSDIDRGVYEELDLRVARHPSEAGPFLLCRVLAYALNFQEGLQFAPGGLSDPDEPALAIKDPNGGTLLWIEIGNPSTRKLHKAAKTSRRVRVYTYKDAGQLVREIDASQVHHASEIEIFALGERFLSELADTLGRDNQWTLVHNESTLLVTTKDQAIEGDLVPHRAG